MSTADQIIAKLGLLPHPEGGWFRQTWIGPVRQGRATGTAIYFLLRAGERSHWHRVDADEIWLFHAGSPLSLDIAPDAAGPVTRHRLGPDVLAGDAPQVIVPAGFWQAAQTQATTQGDYTLVSCTVSPGFEFAGFELAPPEFTIDGV